MGNEPSASNTIQYIEFNTRGNAADFGDATTSGQGAAGAGNNTRGVWAGGRVPSKTDTIQYITMATLGNATDFGDLTQSGQTSQGGLSSTTRGVFSGYNVYPSSPDHSDVMDYITIASTGNATDFGNLTDSRYGCGGAASAVRGTWMGGQDGSGNSNIIDYITIATTGNATDFGDLTVARYYCAGVSNTIRGIGASGETPYKNTMDYITIASTGNATDYGDLIEATALGGVASNGHGGLVGGQNNNI